MIYLNDNRTEYITEDAFIGCGHDRREELSKIYHKPDAEELYDYLDNLDAWDETDLSAFDQLADLCGLDIGKYDNRDALMKDCAAAINLMIEFEGKKYKLLGDGSAKLEQYVGDDPHYYAYAIDPTEKPDENGNVTTYKVIWEILWDEPGDDESTACDWECPVDVSEFGFKTNPKTGEPADY